MEYLQTVLDMLRKRAYFSQNLDWDSLAVAANALAHEAQTPADCYPAIQMVIKALHEQDNHCFFVGADEKSIRFD